MPTKFPTGSDGPESAAAPAIWTDLEGSKLAAKENFEAASFFRLPPLTVMQKHQLKLSINWLKPENHIIKVMDPTNF